VTVIPRPSTLRFNAKIFGLADLDFYLIFRTIFGQLLQRSIPVNSTRYSQELWEVLRRFQPSGGSFETESVFKEDVQAWRGLEETELQSVTDDNEGNQISPNTQFIVC
jgi:hypothetical protein